MSLNLSARSTSVPVLVKKFQMNFQRLALKVLEYQHRHLKSSNNENGRVKPVIDALNKTIVNWVVDSCWTNPGGATAPSIPIQSLSTTMVEIETQKPWELPRAYESDLDSHLETEDRVNLLADVSQFASRC